MGSPGGTDNLGAIFKINADGTNYSRPWDFTVSFHGGYPLGRLVQASNGMLYGMTQQGGANNHGVLFEYDALSSTYTKKLDFNSSITGRNPIGSLVQTSNGKLYGMTSNGGLYNRGVLFEYNYSTSVYTKIRDLNNPDGTNPQENLI